MLRENDSGRDCGLNRRPMDACDAFTNQTAKNLAFAITSWTVAEYIPPSDVFMMIPEGNFSLQIPIMPGIPDLPAPPALETEFPMDP
jgi:hypothetical protein